MRRTAGFTLLEVLVATALLATGLVLAFASVRSAQAVAARGEQLAARNEHMRAVQDVLRARLQAALPLAFEPAADEGLPGTRFDGSPQRLRFVADVPGYFGRGGPYLHDLQVVRNARGEGVQLQLGLVLVHAGRTLEENPPRAPEVIADGLRSVQLRYRGLDPLLGRLGDWRGEWPWVDHLRPPQLVEITVQPLQGPAWPPLLVAIPQTRPGGGR